MAPHSSTLTWKIPWMEEPGGLQSMGLLRVGHDWVTSLSLSTFMLWRRKWQPTPVFLPGESQGWRSLVGCLWGRTESDTTEATQQQQQQQQPNVWFKKKPLWPLFGEGVVWQWVLQWWAGPQRESCGWVLFWYLPVELWGSHWTQVWFETMLELAGEPMMIGIRFHETSGVSAGFDTKSTLHFFRS